MAGLDPATQSPRACAADDATLKSANLVDFIGSLTRARWKAGSSPAMENYFVAARAMVRVKGVARAETSLTLRRFFAAETQGKARQSAKERRETNGFASSRELFRDRTDK